MSPKAATDSLLQSIAAGDERAFEQLFHTEYAALCSFANRLLASPPTSEDVVQSVFLRLWANRHSLGEIQSLRAYLYKATRNAALDHLKHAGVARKWAVTSASSRTAIDPAPNAQDTMESAEQASSLQNAIALLSPRARDVILMRWRHGMAHSDIAEVLGISVKGVEIQITRALRLMRAFLRPEKPPPA